MIKRRVFAAVVCILIIISIPALGESLFAIVTGTSSLNIRAGMGTGYAWLGSVKRGQWVDVHSRHGNWYYCTDINQKISGYMNAKYLTAASSGSSAGSSFVVNNPISTQFLNLREYPSYQSRVLAIFYNGATGTVLSENNGWCEVSISGIRGYFRKEYLSVSYQEAPSLIENTRVYSKNGGAVNLRSGPGYGYSVIKSFAPGTNVGVYLKSNSSNFWYVGIGATRGFMDKNFLGSSGQSPQPGGSGMNAVVTNTGKWLNLRDRPSLNAKVIGHYGGGTQVRIISQGADWSRVTVLSNGASGYMMSRFLTVYGVPGQAVKRVVHPKRTFVYLRSSASQAGGNVIMRVPHGETVSVLAPLGSWTKVRYGSNVGYMMSWFLK
ncbi:MAG: SH3 domain-containing protein [Christensenellales bacterium]